mgnify:CR=1 FL=1
MTEPAATVPTDPVALAAELVAIDSVNPSLVPGAAGERAAADFCAAWLADRGFDPVYGARPLRRLVQQAIGDQLAKLLLAGDVHDGDVVPVNVSPDGESLILG